MFNIFQFQELILYNCQDEKKYAEFFLRNIEKKAKPNSIEYYEARYNFKIS